MGWKSTIDVRRSTAIEEVVNYLLREKVAALTAVISLKTNKEIEGMLEETGLGDNPDSGWHGLNFNVIDDEE